MGLVNWSGTMFIGAAAIGFPVVFGLLVVNASVGLIAEQLLASTSSGLAFQH